MTILSFMWCFMPLKFHERIMFKTNLKKCKIEYSFIQDQPSCKLSSHINTHKDYTETQQIEQIAQGLVENTGKLTLKNPCFP